MSVANQANEKLAQLVSLAAKIESHLSGGKKGKGENAKTETGFAKGGGGGDSLSKDAAVIGGLSSSLATLIKEVDGMSPKAGDKLASFIIKMSNAVQEAVKNGLDADKVKQLNENLDALVKGSAGFMKEMAMSILYGIPAMIGAVFFGTTLRILFGILKGVKGMDEDSQESIKMILDSAKGALLFGLAMAAYIIIGIPAIIGATLFGTTVLILSNILSKVSADKEAIEGVNAILDLAKGAALFALVMVGIGFLAVPFAMGTLVFILAVSAMLLVFGKLTETEIVTTGLNAIFELAKGAALFALVMVGIGFLAVPFAMGTLVFILAASAMLITFGLLSKAVPSVMTGAEALDIMFKGSLKFAIAMIGIGFFAATFALGALVFILAAGAMLLVFGLLSKEFPEMERGANALDTVSRRIIPFTLALLVAGFLPKQVLLGAVAVSISMFLVGFAAAKLGELDKKGNITTGASVLNKLIAPMIGFSLALGILGAIPGAGPDLFIKIGAVAASITVLGLAAYILGTLDTPLKLVSAGALVVLALAGAMIIMAGALYIISKAEFTQEKATNLGFAILTIGSSTAAVGLISPLVALGSVALTLAALSLLSLTPSLATFKSIGWQEEDGESLKYAIQSVIQGFAHALDGVGIMGLLKIMAAIPLIGKIGTALASLASGVKAMATLSFTEMEYDEKTGKLVPKREVRLTNEDIQAVGTNTAAILNALAQPLTEFGMWSTMGETGFGPFTIGAGYLQKGIRAAGDIGNAISGIAKGVADMASLNVVDYEVRNGKLVPKSVRKLTPADFILAGINTRFILETLMIPLSNFGRESAKGEGIYWGDGYVVKGIEAAAKVGNAISGIAKGVSDMVSLNIVEYAVKDGKLVPTGTPRKLTPDDFITAANNVKEILTALTAPLTDFGREFKNGSSLFGDSALEAGIEATGKIVDPIAKMADMVLKLASGQATINEVINPGTKNAKLVAKGTINFAEAIPIAIENAKKLLYSFPQMFVSLGRYIDKYEDEIDTAIEFLPTMSSAMADILNVSKSYLEITKNIAESPKEKNIDVVLTGLASSLAAMGKSFDKMDNSKVTLYKRFASITEGMTKINTPFEKFTKNFGQFAKDMGVFVKVWETFGKDNADNLKSYADSLKTMSSVDTAKLKEITQALKEQALAQNQLNKTNAGPTTPGGSTTPGSPTTPSKPNTIPSGANTTAGNNTQSQLPQNTPSGKIIKVDAIYINNKEWRG
jgi:hypothetical protein